MSVRDGESGIVDADSIDVNDIDIDGAVGIPPVGCTMAAAVDSRLYRFQPSQQLMRLTNGNAQGDAYVKEVASGYDCGMSIAGYNDIHEGDIIEAFEEVEVKKSL